MAAAVLRHRLAEAGLAEKVTVTSAGTGDWHVGAGADRRARAALRKRGYDDTHTARQFGRTDFADVDLVLGMDHANLRDLRRIAPEGAQIRLFDTDEVPDPYYGDATDFDAALDQIERAADALIAELRAQLQR
jgi:protein-tyrosine phosphatase